MGELSFIEKHGLKISDKSFENCKIDIGQIKPGADTLKTFPELNEWIEFKDYKGKWETEEIKNATIIKFIVAMYDPQSPIRKFFANHHERKIAAAEYAGLRVLESGNFSAEAQKVLNGEDKPTNAMTVRYCVEIGWNKFAAYVKFSNIFHEKTLQAPNIKTKDIKEDLEALETMEDELFGGDRTAGLKRHFYKISSDEEKKLQKLRPEYQARYWENRLLVG